jgi:hypothetical protein
VLEILQLVKEDKEQRNSLADQFGDTVRYLNELNAWMEAFVTKTGGNDLVLQKISETMDRISQDPNAGAFNLRNMGSSGNPEASASLTDVQGLVTQTRAQESVLYELKASIQAVLAAIQDNARQQAELRETQGTVSILINWVRLIRMIRYRRNSRCLRQEQTRARRLAKRYCGESLS